MNASAEQGELSGAGITEGELVIRPLRSDTPAEAKALARRLHALLPRIRITELLDEVDGWTRFGEAFVHHRTGEPARDRRAVLTAVLADGTNLGLTRMAEAQGHRRDGRGGATRPRRPVYHDSGLSIGEHSTDTAAATDQVFAACALLGFRFMPRIRDLGERRLYSFAPPSTYPALEPLITRRINTALIIANWDEILRFVASIRLGIVTASHILKRLAAHPRQSTST